MGFKIHSIVITSVLAFILISAGIPTTLENVLSQEGAITPKGSVNDTMSGQDALHRTTNAILAFAQEDHTGGIQGQEGGGGGDTDRPTEDILGGDTGMTDGTTNTTGGMTDGKSGESGTGNGQ